MEPFLPTPEIEKIQTLRNRPFHLLKTLSVDILSFVQANVKHYPTISNQIKIEHLFDENIHILTSALSSCERLVKQPIPLSYSRHTSRFLFLFMYSLPLVLIPYLGYWTIPTIAATFWSFVSINEIGHFIEEVRCKKCMNMFIYASFSY